MVVHAYYPLGETRAEREAQALVSHGWEVDVVCLRHPNEPPAVCRNAVQVYRLPVALKKDSILKQFVNYLHFFLLAAAKLTQLHLQHHYSSVQVHNLPDFLVFCALIPKLSGVPIILDLHDLMPEFFAGRFAQRPQSLLARLVRWQERMACRFADHVITVSEHWRQALVQRGVPPQKCSVLMNVADPTIFRPADDDQAYLPKGDEFRLIYHGAIVERYGLDLAIRAIGQVRHEIPNVHLTILGSGDFLGALVQMTEDLDLSNNVTFEEVRLAERLPEIIGTANLGIVPNRNDAFTDDLLPTKLMEYAAMGLPAIAARTHAIEAYFHDTMVEFFEPGDVDDLARCIPMLYNSPERLMELARGSKRFNERYNWSKLGAEYVALVEQMSE